MAAASYRRQAPYTTPHCLNVIPRESLEGRERGGSRPAIVTYNSMAVATGESPCLLEEMSISGVTGFSYPAGLRYISNVDLTEPWTMEGRAVKSSTAITAYALYADNTPDPLPSYNAYIVRGDGANLKLYTSIHGVETLIATAAFAHDEMKYRVRFEGDGKIHLYYTHDITANVFYDAGSATLSASCDGNTGFGSGYTTWSITGETDSTNYEKRIAVSMGTDFYFESADGLLTVVTGEYALSDNRQRCAHRTKKLYMPNNGTTPLVFDYATGLITTWTATAGTVPTMCSMACSYRDRVVLAGDSANPHMWYMSRSGDPRDWDYAADDGDMLRAVSGLSADAGQTGQPITALIPWHDDLLVMGCPSSIWVLRGDPAAGGSMDAASQAVGIHSMGAWALTPENVIVFLGYDGLYGMPVGGQPQNLSAVGLPLELRGDAIGDAIVSMSWDGYNRGVWIFVTDPDSSGSYSWFFDWPRKSFWRCATVEGYAPHMAIPSLGGSGRPNGVIMLSGDGNIRHFDRSALTDDGEDIESYVMLGPMALGDGFSDGILTMLRGALDASSGAVDWSLRVAQTSEAAANMLSAPFASGAWTAGVSYLERPRARGQAWTLLLESSSVWAFEAAFASISGKGRMRGIV